MKHKQSSDSSSLHSFLRSTTLFLISALLINSCSEQSITPKEILKDPKEMIWTADTISYPGSLQTMLTSMWVAAPNDIWVAGHNERSLGEIFHFNGSNWQENDPMNDIPRSPKSINQVMGINYHDIWMVGDRWGYNRKDLIINWNGTMWKEHNLNLQIRTLRLFTNGNKDIWIGCDSAVVLHYDGIKWERDMPKLNIAKETEHFINGIVVKNDTVYLNIASYDQPKRRYVYFSVKGTMKNWIVIDSMEIKDPASIIKFGNRGISLGKEGGMYSYGDFGVWELINNKWAPTLPINYTMQNVYVLNERYKIAVGVYGMVWFYNGLSWRQLTNFYSQEGEISITDAWTDGKEIVLLGHTSAPQKTVVWRGK